MENTDNHGEAEATAVAKKYLSYFQGSLTQWDCEDQRVMRNAIPENRLRVYDVRELIRNLADTDSVLELRPPHRGLVRPLPYAAVLSV